MRKRFQNGLRFFGMIHFQKDQFIIPCAEAGRGHVERFLGSDVPISTQTKSIDPGEAMPAGNPQKDVTRGIDRKGHPIEGRSTVAAGGFPRHKGKRGQSQGINFPANSWAANRTPARIPLRSAPSPPWLVRPGFSTRMSSWD